MDKARRIVVVAGSRDGIAGGAAWSLSVDTPDAEAVDAAAGRIERELGPIKADPGTPQGRPACEPLGARGLREGLRDVYGTQNTFDGRSALRSAQLWASQHHGAVGVAGGGLLGAAALAGAALLRTVNP